MKAKQIKISIVTLGCAKNTVDSERIIGSLKSAGALIVEDPKKADIVIINTCGFIEPAKEESIQAILEAGELKRKGKIQKVIAVGCLTERYKDDLKNEIPEIDMLFGVEAYADILNALNLKTELLGERSLLTPKHFAYLKIAEGCDRKCSFCAIPLIRGGHVSRDKNGIIQEAKGLISAGTKELILIAQDTTYYGRDIYGKKALPELLRELSDIKDDIWIRLMYAYPTDFPKDILEVIAERANICKYIDMPLQHISDSMLKSMKRGIDKKKTYKLIEDIRKIIPNVALRTALITGYPGESKEEFAELLQFVEDAQFDKLGVFTYSHEEDTAAYAFEDDIPEDVKEERRDAIMELQRDISLAKNQEKVGKTLKAIVEEISEGEYIGRTEFDAPEVDGEIFIRSERKLEIGEFVNVEITDAYEYDISGVAV